MNAIGSRRNAGLWIGMILGALGAAFAQTPTRVRFASLPSKVEPVYPIAAKEKGIEGAVRLDTVIGKDGHVTKVAVISGNPALVDAARVAVHQWVYRPTLLNGEPIQVVTEVCVPFVLSKHTLTPCTKRRIRH